MASQAPPSTPSKPTITSPPPVEDAFSSAAKTFASPVRLPSSASGSHSPTSVAATAIPRGAEPPPVPDAASSAAAPAASSYPLTDEEVNKRVQNDKVVMRQAATQQAQALRAIAHRAATDMENWRTTVGEGQQSELLLYWSLWSDYMLRACKANDKILDYTRTFAVASSAYASALVAAGAGLAAIASGDMLDQPVAVELGGTGHPAGSGSGSSGSSGGATGASGGKAAAAPSSRDGATGGRHALSLSVVTACMRDLQGQVTGIISDVTKGHLAIVGDEDAKHPSKRSISKAEIEGSKAAPTDLAGVVAWYEAVATELRKDGAGLASTLEEGGDLAAKAYAELEQLTHAYMTGDKLKTKGKDLWLAELKYRRVMRGLLAIKQRYLNCMAQLFERYRRAESHRCEAVAAAVDAHATSISKLFDRVSAKQLVEAVKTLNTHADFCRVVEEDARQRILAQREEHRRNAAMAAAAAAGSKSGSAPSSSTGGAAAVGPFQAYHSTALGSASPTLDSAAAAAPASSSHSHHIHFTIEAAPAVITPFASPLVVRTGLLLRQVGIMKVWRQCIGVLTRDSQLHLLGLDEDLATHPDVITAVYRTNAGGGTGYGGSAGHLQAMSTAAIEAATAAAAASSSRSSAAEATPRTPGGHASGSVDIADAAAAAVPRLRSTSSSSSSASQPVFRLPSPALPSQLISFAAAYAAKVDDVLPPSSSASATTATGAGPAAPSSSSAPPSMSHVDALASLRKAGTPPSTTYEVTATTKLAFAPTVHAHAFELSDAKGWFGSTKLVLRAGNQEDTVDWICALNAAVDAAAV